MRDKVYRPGRDGPKTPMQPMRVDKVYRPALDGPKTPMTSLGMMNKPKPALGMAAKKEALRRMRGNR